MAATTTELLTRCIGLVPAKATYGIAASTKLLKATIVCQDANGRAAVPSAAGTAGIPAAGVAAATYDNSAGAADAMNAELKLGGYGFQIDGTTPKPMDLVYVVDNQTVSLSSDDGAAETRGVAGFVSEVRDSLAYVVFNPYLAGISKILADHEARIVVLETP